MGELSQKIAITDMYHSLSLGYWFARENQRYAAGSLSESQRLLFRSLILLDESHGKVLREWYWNYSHCVELELSNSSLFIKVAKNSNDGIPYQPTLKWFSKQMGMLQKGTLLAQQESAMKELLARL